MAYDLDPQRFRFEGAGAEAVRGKRVLITGSGKHGGLGQAFAYACALAGARAIGIHFYRSAAHGLETVERLRALGCDAFPVQADVTSPSEVWSIRSHVIRKLGGAPPELLICNSGLAERGYLLGRVPREIEGEGPAKRRARARQAFVDNLRASRAVLDTKVEGFLAMTHLWAGEANYAGRTLEIVYVSSRQAIDPGPGVPGYVLANWAVLMLPRLLEINLGRRAEGICACSIALPFVRTAMTEAYVDKPAVFDRWQPRMLETCEAAEALLALLAEPPARRHGRTYQLEVEPAPHAGARALGLSWVPLLLRAERLEQEAGAPLIVGAGGAGSRPPTSP